MKRWMFLFLLTTTFVKAETPAMPVFPDVQLTEAELIRLSKEFSPNRKRIMAKREGQRAVLAQTESQYQWSLGAKGQYMETNEQPLVPQIPIFTPVKSAELVFQKQFSYGVTAKTGIETLQQTSLASNIKNGTTSRVFVQADISLWKNLLGRVSRSTLANSKIQDARAEFLSEIETHQDEIRIRKLYWSLVSNNRSLVVIKDLLNTSEKQLKEALRRQRNSVADTAEVSRYRAQLSNRKSQLLVQQFEREEILTQLRVAVPELNGKNVVLPKIDPGKTEREVLKCVDVILASKGLPLENTKYDEIIGSLRLEKEATAIKNNTIDDPELKLTTKLMTTGVSNSYGNAVSDFSDNNRSGFQVGLALNIPLGGDLKQARDAALTRDHLALSAQEDELQAGLIASHSSILQNIKFLIAAIRSQESSAESLKVRLKEVKKKYRQARVSVTELVNDQDDLLNSELSIIQTQLAILRSLFD